MVTIDGKLTIVPFVRPWAVRVTKSPASVNVTATGSVIPVPTTSMPTARLVVFD